MKIKMETTLELSKAEINIIHHALLQLPEANILGDESGLTFEEKRVRRVALSLLEKLPQPQVLSDEEIAALNEAVGL